MKYLTFALLVLTQLSVSAQSIGYQIKVDFGGFELAGNVQQTSDSGLVVCGSASSPTTTDAFIVKIDKAGTIQWKKKYGTPTQTETGNFVTQTSDGGYLLTGYIAVSSQNQDFFVVKTDANGDTSWVRSYGIATNDYGNSCIELPSGNFLISGVSVIGSSKAAVLRLSPSGILLGARFMSPVFPNTSMKGKIVGPNELIVTGAVDMMLYADSTGIFVGQSNVQLSGSGNSIDAIRTASGYNVATGTSGIGAPTGTAIAIYSTPPFGVAGTPWINQYTSSGNSLTATAIAEGDDFGYAVGGYTSNLSGSQQGLMIMKTDSSGNMQWAKRYTPGNGSEYMSAGLTKTWDGGYALTGYVFSGSSADLVIVKTDSVGVSGCNETALAVTSSPAITTAPSVLGPVNSALSNSGTWVAAATSTSGSNSVLCITVGLNEVENTTSGHSLYPNPFNESLSITSTFTTTTWIITDVVGKSILREEVQGTTSPLLNHLSPGIYLVEVKSGQSTLLKEKVVKF